MASVIIGIILGLGAGILNFKLLLWMMARLASMDPRRAGLFTTAGFMARTALYIVPLLAGIYIKQINVFGVAGGLLAASLLNLRDGNKKID